MLPKNLLRSKSQKNQRQNSIQKKSKLPGSVQYNNLNKGLTVKTNLAAVRFMRALKAEFPREWGYSRAEGAIHGFIHPTPWDTEEISSNIQQIAAPYALPFDILPAHSTPLIIHHASGLGDWIREVERREGVQFQRHGSIIGWW